MRTHPLRKLSGVSDDEWAAWRNAAPNGNRSAWLRELANAALTQERSERNEVPSETLTPHVTIGEPSRDPSREEYLRREAALLSAIHHEE